MNSEFFKNKKVFLTGHTGFKGSWMLVLLNYLGAEVKGYALEAKKNSLFKKFDEHLCESAIGDIRESERVTNELLTFEPDIIFHLAAQPLVLDSYKDPKYTFDVNISGSINVLESFRALKKKCIFIAITTDKVYRNKESFYPYREGDELGGHDPYSASKAALEIVLESYTKSYLSRDNLYGKGLVSVRAGNVIGGGDYSENRILPDIMRSINLHTILEIRNPNSVRPWQHVLDALNGYLNAACYLWDNPCEYGSFNFGPQIDEVITVRELTEKVLEVYGKVDYPISWSTNNEAKEETNRLLLDSYLARNILGWRQNWNGYQAIEKAVEWYRDVEKENSTTLCRKQIKEFYT